MKIDIENRDDHQVLLRVETDSQTMEDAKHRAARKISRETKIPGFRPGKAPYAIVLRSIGEEAVMREALDMLIDDIYPKAIKEAGITPYTSGRLENIPQMDPPIFEFLIPLDADVSLSDYRSIRLPYELKEISEADVARVIEDLRGRHAVLEPVDRPAQLGDMVAMRISGERSKVEAGENPIIVQDYQHSAVVTAEEDADPGEWPFPGFSSHLVGLNPGDEKVIPYTYLEDAVYESLRGKDVVFRVVIEDVRSRTLPDLNDEFAQTIGEYSTLDDLKTTIRQSLERRNKETYEAEYSDQIITQIIDSSTIKYPPQMLDNEIDLLVDELKRQLTNQHLDLDAYLKTRQMEMPALREELTPSALTRLKRSLVIFEVAQVEHLHAEQEEVQAQSIQTLNEIGRSLDPEQSRKVVTGDFIRNLVGNVTVDITIRRTLERLIAIARGENPPILAEEKEDGETDESTEIQEQPTAKTLPVESTPNSDDLQVAENTPAELEG